MPNNKGDRMTLCLRKDDLDWRQIDDEIVALDSREAVYLAIQGSGTLVWRLLAASTTREDLVAALAETYDIDSTKAAADVDEFVTTLNDRGLLAP
jgi:Coenzyme PQQ synthesis protein D (PqqD)